MDTAKVETARLVLTTVVAGAAVLAIIWTLAEGRAEKWVNQHLKQKGYASEESLGSIQKQVDKNAATARTVNERTIRMDTRQQMMLQMLERMERNSRRQ